MQAQNQSIPTLAVETLLATLVVTRGNNGEQTGGNSDQIVDSSGTTQALFSSALEAGGKPFTSQAYPTGSPRPIEAYKLRLRSHNRLSFLDLRRYPQRYPRNQGSLTVKENLSLGFFWDNRCLPQTALTA
ncbi:MAG: hypothetical protein ACI8QC_003033 [Planctomycetota bacterium]|jgi:hypothetical protein